jgi:hypothetical protein
MKQTSSSQVETLVGVICPLWGGLGRTPTPVISIFSRAIATKSTTHCPLFSGSTAPERPNIRPSDKQVQSLFRRFPFFVGHQFHM